MVTKEQEPECKQERIAGIEYENVGSWKTVSYKKRKDKVINNINKSEWEWVREKAIVDSGTIDTVGGPMHVAKEAIRATIASKKGLNYTSASGHTIKNLGEGDVHARSDEGIPIDMTTQVGDSLTKMLISVGRTGEAGNMTIFNCDMAAIREIARKQTIDEHFMYNKKSGISSKIIKEGGLFKYPMWIRKKRDIHLLSPGKEGGHTENQCKKCGDMPCTVHDSAKHDEFF